MNRIERLFIVTREGFPQINISIIIIIAYGHYSETIYSILTRNCVFSPFFIKWKLGRLWSEHVTYAIETSKRKYSRESE